MKIISSGWTWFYKKMPPVVLAVVAVAGFIPLIAVQGKPNPPPFVFIVPLIIVGVAGFLIRRLMINIADEVQDCGDYLLVRFGGQEDQVLLTNIINVSYSIMVNPPRITLRLRQPGRFGRDVAFIPPRSSLADAFRFRSAVADDLIERVDAARKK